MIDPDIDFIRAAQAGDKAAFGTLVNHYYEMVYAVAYGVVRHREVARDVAQEVFMKAFRDIRNFAGNSKFKTWLYRIAMNAAIDQTRLRKPSESLDATDVSDDDDRPALVIPDKSAGPREKVGRQELRALLDEAIQQLSADHRAVLVLREWEELSYEAIAETLGIQVGTVMSRLFYARKKLAEILGMKIPEIKEQV